MDSFVYPAADAPAGTRREPEEQILNLSDAFINKDREADLELRVRMLNINYGHNKELMEKCHTILH